MADPQDGYLDDIFDVLDASTRFLNLTSSLYHTLNFLGPRTLIHSRGLDHHASNDSNQPVART